jgi:Transposase domain (DUF772)
MERRGLTMMGRLTGDQSQLFYEFHLDDAVPADHLVREIDAVLDLSWVHGELTPYYPSIGRPSIDPELMIRMLIVGYVFAIRSERALCREVKVNLAYRWFCKLGIEDQIPDHSAFSAPATSASRRAISSGVSSSAWWRRAFQRARLTHDLPFFLGQHAKISTFLLVLGRRTVR